MDNRSIYSKTGKGSLEITKKSIKLASDERQTLILVDGKSNIGDIEQKLSRVQPMRLRSIIDKLVELDLIREFVSKQGPDSLMLSPGQSAMSVMEVEDELDFTALAPTSSANTIKEVEERRVAALKAEEEARREREENERVAAIEAAARAKVEAEAKAKADAEARVKAEQAARIKAIEDEARRKVEEEMRQKAEAEARRRAEEEARRKAEEEARRKIEDEARRKVEEEMRQKAEAEARRKAEEEARRNADDEARRKVEEEARRNAEEEARRKAEEEARRKAEEEARRKADEEARRKAEDEARLKSEDEARSKAEAEARSKAEQEARRKAEEEVRRKAEEEERRKLEEEARRRAAEEARRKAEDAARQKAEEDARHKAEAEARQKAEEEGRRKAAEAARVKAEEEARRVAEEESRIRSEAEARFRAEAEARIRAEAEATVRAEEEARMAAERDRAREHAEAQEREELLRRQRSEADSLLREQTERRAREETEARERSRREEEAKRLGIEDEKRRATEESAAAEAAEAARRSDEEAARYTAALAPHLEAATPAAEAESLDLDFNAAAKPAGADQDDSILLKPGAGPDSFMESGSPSELDFSDSQGGGDEVADRKKASRKELEREAKENAKAAARAKKQAERDAKQLAQDSKVTIRRGGGFSMGKIAAILVVLVIVGAIGYLYLMPIDKAAVERQATMRLGEPVKVGSAKFSPFPPQLTLTNVVIGDITLPQVVAVPDSGSLASDQKIWKSIDVSGISVTTEQAKKLADLALMEAPRAPGGGPTMTIQRVRALKSSISDAPVQLPPVDITVLLGASGSLKQATFTLADGKAQLQITPDDKNWTVDFESHGVTWPVGPKVAWESVRAAKGVATNAGVKFDSVAITSFAGTASGPGELSWAGGWKYNGSFEVGGLDTDAMGQAFYGASPVTGTMDGKMTVAMAAPTLAQLFASTKIDGDVSVNKATVKNLDLARTAQSGAPTAGKTPFSDFSCTLGFAGGKLQVKNVKAISGLLNVTGDVTAGSDGNLNGSLNVEIGVGSNRTKAAVKVSGPMADPKLSN